MGRGAPVPIAVHANAIRAFGGGRGGTAGGAIMSMPARGRGVGGPILMTPTGGAVGISPVRWRHPPMGEHMGAFPGAGATIIRSGGTDYQIQQIIILLIL